MSESFYIPLGDPLPLSLTLPDGAAGVFPRARIYDSADSEVAGSPFNLTEVGATGRYTGASFTPLVVGTFTARFVVYSDGGHTTELLLYERVQDSYVVVADIADAVWDEVLTGATHNVTNSAGRRLRQLADRGIITDGIAQAGASTSIDLAASESAVDDEFNDYLIGIVGGTGSGQLRLILDYTGASRRADVHRAWIVTPDATSEYVIGLLGASAAVNVIADGVWDEAVSGHQTAGTFGRNATTIAAEDVATVGSTSTEIRTALAQADDFFNNMQVVVVNSAGTAVRNIDDFANTNGAITVTALPFTPSISDPVIILRRTGSVPTDTASIADAVWDEAKAAHTGVGSFGEEVQTHSTHTAADVDTVLTASHGAGSWTTATGFSTHSAADVADAVWDEATVDHTGVGSFGKLVQDIDANVLLIPTGVVDVDEAAIADAVWDEARVDHTGVGTFGEFVNVDVDAIRLEIMTHVLEGNTLGFTVESTLNFLRKIQFNRLELKDGETDNLQLFDDNNTTIIFEWNTTDKKGNAIIIPEKGPARRGIGGAP